MTSIAPAYSLEQFKVKQGDEVTITITNIDEVEDLTHGFTIYATASMMEIAPQADRLRDVLADRPASTGTTANGSATPCTWKCRAA